MNDDSLNFKDLRNQLMDLYPNQNDVIMLLDDCEISHSNIDLTGSSKIRWHQVLKVLDRSLLKIKILLDAVAEEFPDNLIVTRYLEEENHRINEHRKEFTKVVIKKSPTQTQSIKDALSGLIVHESEYEKIIGSRNDLTPIAWIKNAARASRSVCKVLLPNGASGTGWIYKNNYLITNNHVIENERVASSARIIFNYGGLSDAPERIYSLNPQERFHYSPKDKLDYTLVSIADPDDSLIQLGSLTISETLPQVNDLVNIIQHPKGDLMKMAMPDEVISIWKERDYLFYKCDTLSGSSGSPVFNQNWEVVALHHAGNTKGIRINQKGDITGANRGILIGSIIDHINKYGNG